MSSTAAVKRKNMKHYSVGSIIWIIVEYASLIFFGFCAIIPIVSCITTAFKTDAEYQNTNVMAFPGSWLNFDNFVNAFKTANMGRAFLNSVIVMVVVLTVSVIVGSQLAYVLNRFKFPGNGFIRNLYTIAALLPAVAMQVTVYQIMSDLHLVNSLGGYIIMSCGTDVISMYIFIQFMENIPLSLDESAIIDGANYWQILLHITIPSIRPVLITSIWIALMANFQMYTIIANITNGGPVGATTTLSIAAYNAAFQSYNFGYGAAIGVVWLIVLFIITMFSNKLTDKYSEDLG